MKSHRRQAVSEPQRSGFVLISAFICMVIGVFAFYMYYWYLSSSISRESHRQFEEEQARISAQRRIFKPTIYEKQSPDKRFVLKHFKSRKDSIANTCQLIANTTGRVLAEFQADSFVVEVKWRGDSRVAAISQRIDKRADTMLVVIADDERTARVLQLSEAIKPFIPQQRMQHTWLAQNTMLFERWKEPGQYLQVYWANRARCDRPKQRGAWSAGAWDRDVGCELQIDVEQDGSLTIVKTVVGRHSFFDWPIERMKPAG